MANVYDQHDAAFNKVSAYVITDKKGRVATVAFKAPKDGIGALYCYLHFLGLPMQRAKATGCGYDKYRAAFGFALDKCLQIVPANSTEMEYCANIHLIGLEFEKDKHGGGDFKNLIELAGFNIYKAV